MIHDKIHTDIHVFLMTCRRQAFQVLHRPQLLLYLTEIRHCVPAVRTSFHSIQERHQMDIIHIALLKILKLRFNALHIAGEIINIEHHSQHIILFIPVRTFLSLAVPLLQVVITRFIETIQVIAQLGEHRAIPV